MSAYSYCRSCESAMDPITLSEIASLSNGREVRFYCDSCGEERDDVDLNIVLAALAEAIIELKERGE